MTNERAVEILNLDLDILGQYGDETAEAYKMAIKALDAQPCEDCISRQAVQDLISRWLSDYLLDETREALETINYKVGDMPSVTPQRPKGKWIKCKSRFEVTYFKCSECGRKLNWIDRDDNYCNSCGSDNSESTKEWFKEWDTKLAEMGGEEDG